jgi:multidrug resistance efflux pump
MNNSYRFTDPYQIEVQKAKSAIETHTRNIAYLNATIIKKQKSIQKREKLLEIARKRLEFAKEKIQELDVEEWAKQLPMG